MTLQGWLEKYEISAHMYMVCGYETSTLHCKSLSSKLEELNPHIFITERMSTRLRNGLRIFQYLRHLESSVEAFYFVQEVENNKRLQLPMRIYLVVSFLCIWCFDFIHFVPFTSLHACPQVCCYSTTRLRSNTSADVLSVQFHAPLGLRKPSMAVWSSLVLIRLFHHQLALIVS
jgi:hypothetical protein